jgi:hypothetical protein
MFQPANWTSPIVNGAGEGIEPSFPKWWCKVAKVQVLSLKIDWWGIGFAF